MISKEEIEILNNLSKYLQFKIDSGQHKIIYNNLMHDEKTIDCINAIETLVQAVENSIPKSVVEEKIKEMERMSKLAEKCINQKTIIADSDSLHYGEKIAHKTDANILRELL